MGVDNDEPAHDNRSAGRHADEHHDNNGTLTTDYEVISASEATGIAAGSGENLKFFECLSYDRCNYALPLFAVVLNVVYFCLCFKLNNWEEIPYRLVFNVTRLLLYFACVVLVLCGFSLSSKFRSRPSGYGVAAVLFIVPTFFISIYNFFRLLPQSMYLIELYSGVDTTDTYFAGNLTYMYNETCAVSVEKAIDNISAVDFNTGTCCARPVLAWISVIEILVHILQMYTQTSFVIHIFQLAAVRNDVLTKRESTIFRSIIISLVLWNFAFWVYVSFTSLNHSFDNNCLHGYYLDFAAWQLLQELTRPILVFFRFQSCAAFLMYLFKYEYK